MCAIRRDAIIGALFALATLGTAPASNGPGGFEGRVVGVHDGDTLTVLAAGREAAKVRLVEIDAPESAQPYGARSKEALSDLVYARTVRVRSEGRDRYGRTLGRVYVDGRDVNKAMVRAGAAWVYDAYSRDPSFPPLQARAKAERAGLWALQSDQVTAPWLWRRGERPRAAAVEVAAAGPLRRTPRPSTAACPVRRTCRQMDSCAEAEAYVRACGPSGVDGDNDGVPCEALCSRPSA